MPAWHCVTRVNDQTLLFWSSFPASLRVRMGRLGHAPSTIQISRDTMSEWWPTHKLLYLLLFTSSHFWFWTAGVYKKSLGNLWINSASDFSTASMYSMGWIDWRVKSLIWNCVIYTAFTTPKLYSVSSKLEKNYEIIVAADCIAEITLSYSRTYLSVGVTSCTDWLDQPVRRWTGRLTRRLQT